MSLRNLSRALLIGCVLVILVLLVFLADWRTALISSIAIPLSLLTAGVLLHYRGGTLDTMVLAGLVIALGEVVDDAIIDVENIVRRLRLNATLAQPRPALEVVLAASLEVRSAVLYGSLIVMLVFVPVFLLEGLTGAFFRPLALAYVLAILASLAVALTITPALALLLLPKHLDARDVRLVSGLKARYRRLLRSFVDRPKAAFGTLAVLLVLTAGTVPFLGEEFLPHFREYDFLMHWVEKPGTSIDAMRRITERASRELMAVPGVRNFGSHIGRAEVADEVVGPNFTELWISLDPSVDYEPTVAKIQSIVDGYPGLYRDLLTYLRERIKEVLTGASATIVVRVVRVPSWTTLRSQAQAVREAMRGIRGRRRSDRAGAGARAADRGAVPARDARPASALTPGQVRQRRRHAGAGHEGRRVLRGPAALRRRRLGRARGPRESRRGAQPAIAARRAAGIVPLGSVADVDVMPTPNEITRENGSRRIDVTCNVRGRDLGAVARDIEARLAGLHVPAGLPRGGAGRVRRAAGLVDAADAARRPARWSASS